MGQPRVKMLGLVSNHHYPDVFKLSHLIETLPALTQISPDLTPEQEHFSELVKQAERLTLKIRGLRSLVDQHRTVHQTTLKPLQKRQETLRKSMVIWLDQRLEKGGLPTRHQKLMHRLICKLAIDFALAGDHDMRKLHDAHSDESLADIQQAQAREAQAYFEQTMGRELEEDEPFETVDDVLHAKFEQLRKQAEQRESQKEKRKNKRTKSASQLQAEQLLADAQGALRTIYRQLASAVHPDRESDPIERARKTQLMSDANTAYGRGDLLTLLHLQLEANLTETQIASNLAHDKIVALTSVITHRTQGIQRELRDVELDAISEFGMSAAATVTEASLSRHLATLQRRFHSEITSIKSDLLTVRDDAGLKRWLKEQDAD